jgi:predicted PurR-regulated permease PerM
MDEIRAATGTLRRAQRVALGVLMGLAFVAVAWISAPLLVGLVLGTVMGFTAQPLHGRLCVWMGERRPLAAAFATLLGGLTIVGGSALVFWILAPQLRATVELVQREVLSGFRTPLGARTTRLLDALGLPQEVVAARLRDELGRASDVIARGAGALVEASAGALLTFVVGLWTMFYVLRDWPRIATRLEHLLPLHPRHTRALVDEFRHVGRQAFVGAVASAVIQGGLAALGFALFGVPQAIAWGALLAILSFIPVFGAPLVWIPAALWLLSTGHLVRAILLTSWSLVLVMAANDYVVRPRLVGRGEGHPLLMLVAIIGGISVFGIAGLIVGPVIMSLFVATARIYEREREADLFVHSPSAAVALDESQASH